MQMVQPAHTHTVPVPVNTGELTAKLGTVNLGFVVQTIVKIVDPTLIYSYDNAVEFIACILCTQCVHVAPLRDSKYCTSC